MHFDKEKIWHEIYWRDKLALEAQMMSLGVYPSMKHHPLTENSEYLTDAEIAQLADFSVSKLRAICQGKAYTKDKYVGYAMWFVFGCVFALAATGQL